MCRVYCDGNGERRLALVAVLFERGVREVVGVVQTVPVRLIRLAVGDLELAGWYV